MPKSERIKSKYGTYQEYPEGHYVSGMLQDQYPWLGDSIIAKINKCSSPSIVTDGASFYFHIYNILLPLYNKDLPDLKKKRDLIESIGAIPQGVHIYSRENLKHLEKQTRPGSMYLETSDFVVTIYELAKLKLINSNGTKLDISDIDSPETFYFEASAPDITVDTYSLYRKELPLGDPIPSSADSVEKIEPLTREEIIRIDKPHVVSTSTSQTSENNEPFRQKNIEIIQKAVPYLMEKYGEITQRVIDHYFDTNQSTTTISWTEISNFYSDDYNFSTISEEAFFNYLKEIGLSGDVVEDKSFGADIFKSLVLLDSLAKTTDYLLQYSGELTSLARKIDRLTEDDYRFLSLDSTYTYDLRTKKGYLSPFVQDKVLSLFNVSPLDWDTLLGDMRVDGKNDSLQRIPLEIITQFLEARISNSVLIDEMDGYVSRESLIQTLLDKYGKSNRKLITIILSNVISHLKADVRTDKKQRKSLVEKQGQILISSSTIATLLEEVDDLFSEYYSQ